MAPRSMGIAVEQQLVIHELDISIAGKAMLLCLPLVVY